MSIVSPLLPGARVLDLFAGSGALGLEALSRGAATVDFVERAPPSIEAIESNIATLGATATRVHRQDAQRFADSLDAHAFDVSFADPPYDGGFAAALADRWSVCPFADVLGIEHRAWDRLEGGAETRRYGSTAITFFRLP